MATDRRRRILLAEAARFGSDQTRCAATTASYSRCKRKPARGSIFCTQHGKDRKP